MATPIYDSVREDLGIDPKEQTSVSHMRRFQNIIDSNASTILKEEPK